MVACRWLRVVVVTEVAAGQVGLFVRPLEGRSVTEAEWLACEDPRHLLGYLRGRGTDRKFTLLAAAWCRHGPTLRPDADEVSLLDLLERAADARLGDDEYWRGLETFLDNAARNPVSLADPAGALRALSRHAVMIAVDRSDAFEKADWVLSKIGLAGVFCDPPDVPASLTAECALLRDIFGNPFRPVRLRPEWMTEGVVVRAAQIYESRDFTEMSVLADALEDARCDNADVLSHCRDAGPHVRGCWVIDLLLGKESARAGSGAAPDPVA